MFTVVEWFYSSRFFSLIVDNKSFAFSTFFLCYIKDIRFQVKMKSDWLPSTEFNSFEVFPADLERKITGISNFVEDKAFIKLWLKI